MVRIVEEAVAHVPLVTSSTQDPSTIPTVPIVSSWRYSIFYVSNAPIYAKDGQENGAVN